MVLYLLFAASVISWAIIFSKFLSLYWARRGLRRFARVFWDTKNLSSIYAVSLEMSTNPMAQVFCAGYQELNAAYAQRRAASFYQPSCRQLAQGELRERRASVRRVIREQVRWLERSLSFLATTASTAPSSPVGTVWGIMNAFQGLVRSSRRACRQSAPGIAEALVATAVGLAAANSGGDGLPITSDAKCGCWRRT